MDWNSRMKWSNSKPITTSNGKLSQGLLSWFAYACLLSDCNHYLIYGLIVKQPKDLYFKFHGQWYLIIFHINYFNSPFFLTSIHIATNILA